MKQPATKNRKSSSRKPNNRKRLILACLAVFFIVTAAVSIDTYVNYQTNQRKAEQAFAADKARFTKLEADMAEAYTAMIAAAGKPESESVSKSCSHIAVKFEEGDLRCAILYKFISLPLDINAIKDDLILRDNAIVKTGRFKKTADTRTPNDILGAITNRRALELSYLQRGHVSCKLTLDPENYDPVANEIVRWNYTFSCRDNTIEPIYPLAE